ncbi:MAG: YbhN family protein [Pseudomonadota bacterium]
MLPGPAHVDAGSSNPPVGSAPTPAGRGSRAARIRRRLGQLAMLVALGFLVHQLRSEVDALQPVQAGAETNLRVLVAFAACLLVSLAGVGCWWVLLEPRNRDTLARLGVVFAYSQVAKYLPGNVFQYAFGVAVGDRLGISKKAMAVVLAQDTVFSIGIAAVLGGIGVFFGGQRAAVEPFFRDGVARIVALTVAGVAVLAILLVVAARSPRVRTLLASGLRLPGFGPLAILTALTTIQFGLYGVAAAQLAALWNPAGVAELPSLPAMTTGFALGWIAGVVVPGAPGGLGVREAVLYALFAPALGGPVAVATFVAMRIVLVAAELAFFVPAPWLLRRLERRPAPHLRATQMNVGITEPSAANAGSGIARNTGASRETEGSP